MDSYNNSYGSASLLKSLNVLDHLLLLLLGGAEDVLDLVDELPGPGVGWDVEEEHAPPHHPVQYGEGPVQRDSLLVLSRRSYTKRGSTI